MLTRLKKRLFRRSCREVSRLISKMQDHPLGWYERFLLRTHLAICDNCVHYQKQVRFMSRAMGRWKSYGGEPGSEEP
jgi:hypothetical protein